MGVLPQALEIIFKMQRKKNNEKIAVRKISFPTYKTIFFLLFGPTLKASNFSFLVHFKQFKVL